MPQAPLYPRAGMSPEHIAMFNAVRDRQLAASGGLMLFEYWSAVDLIIGVHACTEAEIALIRGDEKPILALEEIVRQQILDGLRNDPLVARRDVVAKVRNQALADGDTELREAADAADLEIVHFEARVRRAR